ncbi:MAG: TVP38/TMEM64 family protein [Planctomycetota bacterium]|nr:TVP38/TMEM64 family protein [Planctomycetota bacterium]MDA1248976.1 TVP38/TMEM64 family protein [Planctomycetota bacterium]
MTDDADSAHSESTPTEASRGRKIGLALLGVALLTGLVLAYFFLSIDFLASQETKLRQGYAEAPALVLAAAFLIYVIATGLSLPGAAIMTLVIGWFFGFWRAFILVSFASTAGATLAFLLSRYFLRDSIQNRFGEHLKKFNEALDREGAFYLFTLRLIPAVPFFVINVVMGLTKIRTATYWWVSQVGMLAGTCVYVYAGTTIPSLSQIADPSLLRVTDISDWTSFKSKLREPKLHMPAALLHEWLTKEERACLDDELTPESKLQLVRGINRVLAERNFALRPPFNGAPFLLGPKPDHSRESAPPLKVENEDVFAAKFLEPDDSKSVRRQVTAINRSVLVLNIPEVLPPQPILSKQLLLAFALLGLFPLIVKKLMSRFRPADPASTSERTSS